KNLHYLIVIDFREVRRRTLPMCSFSDRGSCEHIVGGVASRVVPLLGERIPLKILTRRALYSYFVLRSFRSIPADDVTIGGSSRSLSCRSQGGQYATGIECHTLGSWPIHQCRCRRFGQNH